MLSLVILAKQFPRVRYIYITNSTKAEPTINGLCKLVSFLVDKLFYSSVHYKKVLCPL